MSSYYASLSDVYGTNLSAPICDPACSLLNPVGQQDEYMFPYEKYEREYASVPNTSIEKKNVYVSAENDSNQFSLSELKKRIVTNDVPQESSEKIMYSKDPVSIAEIFLYILSGIFIILMMEQILQIGINMQ